ncbi:Pentatricopeptide repeat-containing protein, chloroplastic [Symbiodinium microadriaticum]|uniref:Pentatricopeptide repeat-containing protein, chloroplastic n=1 Tax=Symbiodinium microadriaticum TaxID=2951 RepID=A0A1Q9DUZ9_SYMMI|nr:Pentatricopeptide repeat-containing protein, chloroplastic [Symbiodinium microadriaticum]CAE7610935.1 unnamed protein product [Symbiodinium microadriaticum]
MAVNCLAVGSTSTSSHCHYEVQTLQRLVQYSPQSANEVRRLLGDTMMHFAPDARATTRLLSKLAKAGKSEAALAFLQCCQEVGLEANVFHFAAVLRAFAQSSGWDAALVLLGDMEQKSVRSNVIAQSCAITACEKGGKWVEALVLLKSMRSSTMELDTVAVNSVISACEKAGLWQLALRLLSVLQEDSLEASCVSYSAAISACEKGTAWTQALNLLDAMATESIQVNTISCSAAISACARKGEWTQALQILNQMARMEVAINEVALSGVVSACEKASAWLEAMALLQASRPMSVSPDTIFFCAAITACANRGEWAQALGLLHSMDQAVVAKNLITFNAVISACHEGGEWQKALDLFETCASARLKRDIVTYNATIGACGQGYGDARSHWFVGASVELGGRGMIYEATDHCCQSLERALYPLPIEQPPVLHWVGLAAEVCQLSAHRIHAGLYPQQPFREIPLGEDVSAAEFLQELELPTVDKVYVKVPHGYPEEVLEYLTERLGGDVLPDMVELLCRTRLWYLEYKDTIEELGLKELALIPELFRTFHGKVARCAMASIHVDGMPVMSCAELWRWVKLRGDFAVISLLADAIRKVTLHPDEALTEGERKIVGSVGQGAVTLALNVLNQGVKRARENIVIPVRNLGVVTSFPAAEKSRKDSLQATGAQWETALWALMVAQEQNLLPTVITCNSAILGCARARSWQAALSLLGSSALHQVRPNVISYEAAALACQASASLCVLLSEVFNLGMRAAAQVRQ